MTARDKTALTALYANNTSGDISAQDGRDVIDTALGCYGSILVTKGASTAQGSIDTTPVPVSGFDAAGGVADNVTEDHANNDLEVAVAGDYLIWWHLSLSSLTASALFLFEIYTGNAVSASGFSSRITTNATPDPVTIGGMGLVTLAAGDFIKLYVSSGSSGRSMTPTDGVLACKMIG